MSKSVAIEGLPGAGKSTLIVTLRERFRAATCLGEIVLAPAPVTRSFCVANDYAKSTEMARHRYVLLDRFWASTVAYVLAEERLRRRQTEPSSVITGLYESMLPTPTAWILLEAPHALAHSRATDGLFGDADFRELLWCAYLELAEWLKVPVLRTTADDPAIASFIGQYLFDE